MQRGCRNTDTNSTNRAPSLFVAAAEAVVAVDFSAALIGREINIAPVKMRTAIPVAKRTDLFKCFIQPPPYGSAACGCASRLRQIPHLRSPELCTALPVLRC